MLRQILIGLLRPSAWLTSKPLAAVIGLAGAALGAAPVANAQPVIIRGEPTCTTCTIERQVIARIGERGDGSIKGPVVTPVARDSRGRYYVNDQEDGPVKVFGADGRFSKLLGGKGEAPGEFLSAATLAFGARDSVFVTDRSLAICNVFDPELRFVRSFPIAAAGIGIHAAMANDLLIVNASSNRYAGFPFLVFDATGRLVKQVGPVEPRMDETQTWRTERIIGRAQNGKGGLIVAHRNWYQWWKLSSDLEPETEFVREASWFRGYAPPMAREPLPAWADGVSYLKAIWEDDENRTWVALGTIDVRILADGTAERTESSRIEVLDPATRSVMASVTWPETFVSGFSDGTVVMTEGRKDRPTVLSVMRLSLRR